MSGPRFFPASWRYATRADAEGIGIVFSMGAQGVCAVRLELDDARAMQQALADELTHFHLERRGLDALIPLCPQPAASAAPADSLGDRSTFVRFLMVALAICICVCGVGVLLSILAAFSEVSP